MAAAPRDCSVLVAPVLAAAANADRILAALPMQIHVGSDDGPSERLPVGIAEIGEFIAYLEPVESASANALMDGLHLHERKVRVEFDRCVRPRQADVREQRSEPAVGVDDALVAFISRIA